MDQRKPATPAAAPFRRGEGGQTAELRERRAGMAPAAERAGGRAHDSTGAEPGLSLGGRPPRGDQPRPEVPRGDIPVDRHISHQLRAIYDEVVSEPIPDRFVKLLAELERKQAGKS